MTEQSKAATNNDNQPIPVLVVEETSETELLKKALAELAELKAKYDAVTSAPTLQDAEEGRMAKTLEEAEQLLCITPPYNISELLTRFEKSIHKSIDDKKTRRLKPLTDAKNILLRYFIERMIEKTGRFDMTDMIPFQESCISCKGTGELYKFFRKGETVPCKFCNTPEHEAAGKGYQLIPCRSCKGSGIYKPAGRDGILCTRCQKDELGNPTGKERVKCRSCQATSVYRRPVLDAKIKSTTHCRECKGRGFTLPEPDFSKKKKAPRNPVITEDLASKIKSANTTE